MKSKHILILSLLLIQWACKAPMIDENLPVDESIRLNQIGFYPDQQKIAVILNHEEAEDFVIWDLDKKDIVYEGKLSEDIVKTFSGQNSRIADFSQFNQVGNYVFVLSGVSKSYPFEIQTDINKELGKASIKAFYYQRASLELDNAHAGVWARSKGHPDDQVMIHPSAVSTSRKVGDLFSSEKGWYDAGDYNKYVVNSGITMGTLLSLFEDYPSYFQKLELNIPESGDQIPDLLDEIRWNLDWMITMQDPGDGGVYHKLTTAKFEGMVEPHLAVSQRYFVAKSSTATLDFAAVMAQASRVYKAYFPEESVTYLKAAEKAWNWTIANPEVLYTQNEMNETYDPDVVTGTYGDNNPIDERIWAASELFITTHNLSYWEELANADQSFKLPSWNQVAWLGYYSLLRHQDSITLLPQEWMAMLKINLLSAARAQLEGTDATAFHTPMETNVRNFIWGSNAVAANQGILLLYAYKQSNEHVFLDGAYNNLDYILGRNATGYSYVTGFGSKTPMHPHHRLAESRPDLPPLPGFIVGGPNPGQQDGCTYISSFADESYTDESCSYASNEIAINWNAPFAYLSNSLEAISQ
ncbi:glycoside hydrolase family 9 protein [Algoriphagus sp. D3-2-R+10]|uniref:glycoside hydrolase family 9 protein n=1 Tax=Algoriphagus aurantiacus TaxID=3103948 RepID=UPI002B3D9BCD|nr:glycoside hydrolase family 9 protein [Algoriphagus sp. D3-2-R+10]MEB2775448.1 glycoside hydrolase family 9 protein [Algoriphagus sp. D3-2-R+10]